MSEGFWMAIDESEKASVISLTLRDLFAAFALAGMTHNSLVDNCPASERAAEHAYKYADAMLSQRTKEHSTTKG